jgi:hypothetical protein
MKLKNLLILLIAIVIAATSINLEARCCGQLQGCLCSGGAERFSGCLWEFWVKHEMIYPFDHIDVVIDDGDPNLTRITLEFEKNEYDCYVYSKYIELYSYTEYKFHFECIYVDEEGEHVQDYDPQGVNNYYTFTTGSDCSMTP